MHVIFLQFKIKVNFYEVVVFTVHGYEFYIVSGILYLTVNRLPKYSTNEWNIWANFKYDSIFPKINK